MKTIKMGLMVVLAGFLFQGCLAHRVNTAAQAFDGYSYSQVWRAALGALHDIRYSVYAMDKEGGFIGGESGGMPWHDYPPRLSVMVTPDRGAVFVECRVVQMDQYVDLVGYGRKTVRAFFSALNLRLARARSGRPGG